MKIFSVDPENIDLTLIREAAEIVKQGGLVAFPTETVYGIAASAKNPEAIKKLCQLKNRPPKKPFSYHFGSREDFFAFAGSGLSQHVRDFFQCFCPGPITVVYFDTVHHKKIGVRIPDNPVTEHFLSACAVPVFAPSANPASQKSPTDPSQVRKYFEDMLDGLIDAGPCTYGKDSTVVDVSETGFQILRQGAVQEEYIQKFFRMKR